MAPFNGKAEIGLVGEAAAPAYSRLFELLGQFLPVRFSRFTAQTATRWEGIIAFASDLDSALGSRPANLPAYVAWEPPGGTRSVGSAVVRFGDCAGLDPCLRLRTMKEEEGGNVGELGLAAGDEVAAWWAGRPVWVRRLKESGELDLVGLLPPVIGERDHLCSYFRAGACLRLLPLVVFLRRLTRSVDWEYTAKRACFVFDDPSLYWRSYGFLNFEALAEHARRLNFFAAVAVISLDAWWQNPSVLSVFRRNAPRLSVLLHGHNHLRLELALAVSAENNLRRMAQALRRFERLERDAQLEVCRVMEPPHGGLTLGTLESLASLGFEGSLATSRLLIDHDAATAWEGALGLDLTTLTLAGGFPVLPRIKTWGATDLSTDILLAAVLGQPVIVAGHHTDLAQGFGLFEELARLINSIPGYEWASPKGIVRACYKQVCRDGTLHVKAYSGRIRLRVPAEVERLVVYRTWLGGANPSEVLAVTSAGKDRFRAAGPKVVGPIPVKPGEILEITSAPAAMIDYRTVPPPRPRLWPVARKVLMEAYDRSAPWRLKARRFLGS